MTEERTIIAPGITKYQKVRRLGDVECEGLLNGSVMVQEKLDGSNVSFRWAEDIEGGGHLVVASRNRCLASDGKVHDSFRGLDAWLETYAGTQLFRACKDNPDLTFRGEWLVRHSIAYPEEVLRKAYIYDIQREDGTYLEWENYRDIIKDYDLLDVPIVCRGVMTAEDVGNLSVGKSLLAPEVFREGVVVKRPGFVNCYGRTTWGKVVTQDFLDRNKISGIGTNKTPDDVAQRFGLLANRMFVMKTIKKMEEQLGRKLVITDMKQLLGHVWHELFEEELWSFTRKRNNRILDLNKVQGAVMSNARITALDYFNGLLDDWVGEVSMEELQAEEPGLSSTPLDTPLVDVGEEQ